MGIIRTTANTTLRDYEIDGVAASGPHKIIKSEERSLFGVVEDAITNAANGIVSYASLATLNADLAHAAGTEGRVYADGTPANDGIYVKSGISGSGSWTRVSDLPALQGDIDDETAARIAADSAEAATRLSADNALSARVTATETELDEHDAGLDDLLLGLTERPGDCASRFTDSVTGDPIAAGPTAAAIIVTAEGNAVNLVGATVLGARQLTSVEQGRSKRARIVVRRVENPADPSNAAVELRAAWFDRNKAQLTGGSASSVLYRFNDSGSINELTVTSGPALAHQVDLAAFVPAGAVYCQLYVQTYDSSAQTAISVLEAYDVTDTGTIAADTLQGIEDALAATQAAAALVSDAAFNQHVALGVVSVLPGSPTDGDIYLLSAAASSHANDIAVRSSGAWTYLTPLVGWQVSIGAVNLKWLGAAWQLDGGSAKSDAQPINDTNTLTIISGDPNEPNPTLSNCTRTIAPDHATVGNTTFKMSITGTGSSVTSSAIWDFSSAPLSIGPAGGINLVTWLASNQYIQEFILDIYTDVGLTGAKEWVRTVINGTAAGYLVNNGAGYAVGDTAIAIDTGTGTLPEDTYVTFAGDDTVYTVDAGSTTALLNIKAPGLKYPVADDVAITASAFINGTYNVSRWTAPEALADLTAWGTVYRVRFLAITNAPNLAVTTINICQIGAMVPPKAQVIFCIDDGHQTFIDGAYPQLKQRGIPLTVNVIPGAVGDGTEVDLATLLTLRDDGNNNDFSGHSYNAEDTSAATMNQVVGFDTQIRQWMVAHELGNPIWRGACLQNLSTFRDALRPYYVAAATGEAASGYTMWPPKKRFNIPRYALHGRANSDFDAVFTQLALSHGLFVFYTHGYDTADTHDITAASLAYLMSKIDAALAANSIEFVTMRQLANRSGWSVDLAPDGSQNVNVPNPLKKYIEQDDFGGAHLTRYNVAGHYDLRLENDADVGNGSIIARPGAQSGASGIGVKNISSVTTAGMRNDGVVFGTDALKACTAIATPAGGTQDKGLLLGTTAHFGVFFGSGAPTLSAAKGSLYLRSDGSSTSTRMYVNTDGGTTWTACTTAA